MIFTTHLTIRIGDINYGNHLGHDRLITLLHQARLDFLHHIGGSETHLFGVGLIMRRLEVDYLGEAFLGETLTVHLQTSAVRQSAFTLHYTVLCGEKNIASAITQMVGFDYTHHKIKRLSDECQSALLAFEKFA